MTDSPSPFSRRLTIWLFNPFRFVAGSQALLLGLAIMFTSSLVGYLGNAHFDGMLDLHIGMAAPVWIFLVEGLINWLALSVILYLAALLTAPSSFRAIDLFGTQALARAPYLIGAIAMLPRQVKEVSEQLVSMGTSDTAIGAPNVAVFIAATILVLLMLVWMVALMYRSYSVSCNLRGKKAVATFIVGLLAAEIVSKVGIGLLLQKSL